MPDTTSPHREPDARKAYCAQYAAEMQRHGSHRCHHLYAFGPNALTSVNDNLRYQRQCYSRGSIKFLLWIYYVASPTFPLHASMTNSSKCILIVQKCTVIERFIILVRFNVLPFQITFPINQALEEKTDDKIIYALNLFLFMNFV